MKLPEGDEFYEPFLRFRIVKPAAWQFMPPAWSPVAQLKNDPDSPEWLAHAAMPFVTFMQRHESDDHAYPTVQVTARRVLGELPDNALARQILDMQVEHLRQTWSDLEVIRATTDAIVAGYRANVIVGDEGDFEKTLGSISTA